jgi:hypothetical protein
MESPTLFGREPALWISSLAAVLAVVAGFGLPGINDGIIAALTAFLTAGAGAWTALRVRPIAPAVFTGVISTGAVLLAAFGLDLSQHQVGLVAAAAAMLVSLVARGQVSPDVVPEAARLVRERQVQG